MSATPELGSRKSHFLVSWTRGTRREEATVLPCRRSAVLVLDWIVLCPTVEALVSRMKGLKMCLRQILSSVVVLSHEFGIAIANYSLETPSKMSLGFLLFEPLTCDGTAVYSVRRQ